MSTETEEPKEPKRVKEPKWVIDNRYIWSGLDGSQVPFSRAETRNGSRGSGTDTRSESEARETYFFRANAARADRAEAAVAEAEARARKAEARAAAAEAEANAARAQAAETAKAKAEAAAAVAVPAETEAAARAEAEVAAARAEDEANAARTREAEANAAKDQAAAEVEKLNKFIQVAAETITKISDPRSTEDAIQPQITDLYGFLENGFLKKNESTAARNLTESIDNSFRTKYKKATNQPATVEDTRESSMSERLGAGLSWAAGALGWSEKGVDRAAAGADGRAAAGADGRAAAGAVGGLPSSDNTAAQFTRQLEQVTNQNGGTSVTTPNNNSENNPETEGEGSTPEPGPQTPEGFDDFFQIWEQTFQDRVDKKIADIIKENKTIKPGKKPKEEKITTGNVNSIADYANLGVNRLVAKTSTNRKGIDKSEIDKKRRNNSDDPINTPIVLEDLVDFLSKDETIEKTPKQNTVLDQLKGKTFKWTGDPLKMFVRSEFRGVDAIFEDITGNLEISDGPTHGAMEAVTVKKITNQKVFRLLSAVESVFRQADKPFGEFLTWVLDPNKPNLAFDSSHNGVRDAAARLLALGRGSYFHRMYTKNEVEAVIGTKQLNETANMYFAKASQVRPDKAQVRKKGDLVPVRVDASYLRGGFVRDFLDDEVLAFFNPRAAATSLEGAYDTALRGMLGRISALNRTELDALDRSEIEQLTYLIHVTQLIQLFSKVEHQSTEDWMNMLFDSNRPPPVLFDPELYHQLDLIYLKNVPEEGEYSLSGFFKTEQGETLRTKVLKKVVDDEIVEDEELVPLVLLGYDRYPTALLNDNARERAKKMASLLKKVQKFVPFGLTASSTKNEFRGDYVEKYAEFLRNFIAKTPPPDSLPTMQSIGEGGETVHPLAISVYRDGSLVVFDPFTRRAVVPNSAPVIVSNEGRVEVTRPSVGIQYRNTHVPLRSMYQHEFDGTVGAVWDVPNWFRTYNLDGSRWRRVSDGSVATVLGAPRVQASGAGDGLRVVYDVVIALPDGCGDEDPVVGLVTYRELQGHLWERVM